MGFALSIILTILAMLAYVALTAWVGERFGMLWFVVLVVLTVVGAGALFG